jgi:aspartyl-tRNA synthetase
MENRIHTEDLHDHIGEEVTLAGWIHNTRDHGKVTFVDLRDTTGIVQLVSKAEDNDAHETVDDLRREWVVKITGEINERPDSMVNEDEKLGDLEVVITNVEVLNESKTPPFDITDDTTDINEETRLEYRYLDLRNQRMHENIKLRSEFVQRCRNFLFDKKFTEIETPLLTKSTPEGSRDFVVPSRRYKGKFYALPQSPQQYKQLLMSGGFERYFQIARAVRDEDLRADRGFEHTQIDIEMSFVERDEVMNLVEEMITHTVEKMGYTIKEKPFPRISYQEAMEKHGADKFDLRTEEEKEEGVLAYAWVVDFPFFEKDDQGDWTFSHNPFSMPKEEHIDDLLAGENIGDILTTQYDLVCNGHESGGGSIRAHKREILEATYEVMDYSQEEIEDSVGHMLEAFDHGTPPHGGIALGVERNIMNLTGEEYLREAQAFPMTRRGKTAVMDAPSEISEDQLYELSLRAREKKNENEDQ